VRPGFTLTSQRSSGFANKLETRFSGGGISLIILPQLDARG